MRNVIFVILCVSTTLQAAFQAEEFSRKNFSSSTSDRVLSRRKRYLIFPEGSSLQLVYCLTMPVIGKSTIFTIGGTAALAWELPHDPFQPYRKKAELLHRKDPPGEYIIKDIINNKDSKGKYQVKQAGTIPMIYSSNILKPWMRQPVRYPSIKYSPSYNRYRYNNYRRQQMTLIPSKFQSKSPAPVYYRQKILPFATHSSLPTSFQQNIYHQVHRRTRRELYSKIEKFLSAQSKDGKACLLKVICETHQRSGEKGSFMEEIMKAVFRVKPNDEHPNEDVYDHAANKSHNCTEIFPTCDASIVQFI